MSYSKALLSIFLFQIIPNGKGIRHTFSCSDRTIGFTATRFISLASVTGTPDCQNITQALPPNWIIRFLALCMKMTHCPTLSLHTILDIWPAADRLSLSHAHHTHKPKHTHTTPQTHTHQTRTHTPHHKNTRTHTAHTTLAHTHTHTTRTPHTYTPHLHARAHTPHYAYTHTRARTPHTPIMTHQYIVSNEW